MEGIVELGNTVEIDKDDDGEVVNKEVTDELAEFSFFDEETNDFRLNIEGASGFGKTNTLSVIIEELADFNIPTLVLDRLGVLTTAAIEVDNMVVVGARDEPGIDIAIPLDEVEIIVDMLLEQGMKVMMDLQTYKGLGEEDEQTLHKAVATVVGGLMDRSHELMRSGNRKRSLVIADEVHHLAPERGTQHVDPVDRHVKKCRSVMMNLATEGGNKGVSSIYSYQRRALTKKTVVTQSDNFIVHRLESGDKSTASKATGIPEDDIDNLDVGEVILKGKMTEQRIVGPIKVRRRNSPDPREEQFEVPEPPEELGSALEDIQDQVQQKEKERKERQDKIEKLEDKLERKEKKIESLEKEANVAETIRRAVNREGGEGVDEEVVKEMEQLQERKEELEDKLESAQSRVSDLEVEKDELEREIEDLETELDEYKEIDVVRKEIAENARSILRQLGETDPEAEDAREELNELKQELREKEDKIDRLKQRKDSEEDLDKLDDYEEFLENDVVQEQIEEAKKHSHAAKRYVKGVLAAILDEEGWVSYDDIRKRLEVSTTNDISSAASTLEAKKVIKKDKRDDGTHVDFNIDGIQDIRKQRAKSEKTEELMEKI